MTSAQWGVVDGFDSDIIALLVLTSAAFARNALGFFAGVGHAAISMVTRASLG